MPRGNYNDFIDALGKRESNNNYRCVNKFGYLGRWQFGKKRLYDLGLSINGYHPKGRPQLKFVTVQEFLNNSTLQDIKMIEHTGQLKNLALKRFSGFIGKEVNGIKITLSGMVAGMHLKGFGGLRDFLNGKDNADGLGTKISEYIEKFGDYDLDLVRPRENKGNQLKILPDIQSRGVEIIPKNG